MRELAAEIGTPDTGFGYRVGAIVDSEIRKKPRIVPFEVVTQKACAALNLEDATPGRIEFGEELVHQRSTSRVDDVVHEDRIYAREAV